jgi:hypothetical protein
MAVIFIDVLGIKGIWLNKDPDQVFQIREIWSELFLQVYAARFPS